jgi:eukaryotic-like serine/threonine-protein kinase
MLTSGTMVAGYRIERVLGTGGMGAVYVVANPELPRRDALKMLHSELSHNDEFRTRFVREADVASMLDHPNIVPSTDAARPTTGCCGSRCNSSTAPTLTPRSKPGP